MSDPSALRGGVEDTVGDEATFGIVTVSDRASAGVYEDLSGPAVLNFFREAVKSRCSSELYRRWHCGLACPYETRDHARKSSVYLHVCSWRAVYRVIPDERSEIESTLKSLVSLKCTPNLNLTPIQAIPGQQHLLL